MWMAAIVGFIVLLIVGIQKSIRPLKDRAYYYPDPYPNDGYRDTQRYEFYVEKPQVIDSLGFHRLRQRVHGWLIPASSGDDGQMVTRLDDPDNAHRPVVLFFHGNGGNLGHLRRSFIAAFQRELPDVDLCIFDYSGYGYSTGQPSEAALHEDARLVMQWLIGTQNYQLQNLTLWGYSLGGAVAAFAAARFQPPRLIMQATFPSMHILAQQVMPSYLSLLTAMCAGDFESEKALAEYRGCLLMMHSHEDDLIPLTLIDAMHQRLSDGHQHLELGDLVRTDGAHAAQHVDWNAIRAFLIKSPTRGARTVGTVGPVPSQPRRPCGTTSPLTSTTTW